jgi:AraC-like DNA-binding protein
VFFGNEGDVMSAETRASFVFRSAAHSPLGRVRAAGLLRFSGSVLTKPMRTLHEYALVYLLHGSGRYVDANGTTCDVKTGDLILLYPGLAHRYGPAKTGQHWTEFFLMFDGPVFDQWEACGLLNRQRPICHVEPVEYWLQRLEGIFSTGQVPRVTAPLIDVCRLQLTLAEILQEGERGRETIADTGWVSHACGLLERDLGQELDLADVAQQLGMHYESFRKRFRQIIGMPPAKYRISRVMDRACDLMQEGTLIDKEIAARLGFCDEFYFSRRFKQVVGCSPRRFREGLPRTG